MRKCLKRIILNVEWIYSNENNDSLEYYIQSEKKIYEIYSVLCKNHIRKNTIKGHLTKEEYEEYLKIEKHFF